LDVNGRRDADPAQPYVLGHSERELARLAEQAELVGPITRRLFQEAGIGLGMRVLDVGSGVGDVAFLASELVGASGEVIGFDLAPAALLVARKRAAERSLGNVAFHDGNPADAAFDRPFDAIVGRYVLMFQSDPVTLLRKLAAHVRPGGVVAFHEIDWEGARSMPPAPLYDASCGWIMETVRRSGAATRMGMMMRGAFLAAGLPAPTMRLEAIIGGGPDGAGLVRLNSEIVITLLSEIESFGVATPAEVGSQTLETRMAREVADRGSVLTGRSEIGAWSRTASS